MQGDIAPVTRSGVVLEAATSSWRIASGVRARRAL